MTSCVLPHGPKPTEAAPPMMVCGWHRRGLDQLVHGIGEDWLNLALIAEAGSAPKDHTPRTGRTTAASPPAPANLDVLVLRDPRTKTAPIPGDPSRSAQNALAVIASWVLLLAEERPVEIPGRVFRVRGKGETTVGPLSFTGQLRLLARYHDWISRQLWVDDYWTELRDMHRAIRGALHDRAHTFIGRCYLPVDGKDEPCGGNLLRANGETSIECHRCRAVWATPGQLARLLHALQRPGA